MPESKEAAHWGFRRVKWGTAFGRQDLPNLILTIGVAVALAVIHWTCTQHVTTVFIQDASIALPYEGSPSIPTWVSYVVPAIMLLLTLVVGEIFYTRQLHKSITDAVATIIYFILDALQTFLIAELLTVVTKTLVGAARPDFLSRCQPANQNSLTFDAALVGMGLPTAFACTQTDQGILDDGYQAFPSGHSSAAFSLTVYASAYLIWCFTMRKPWDPDMGNWTFSRRFKSDLGSLAGRFWMLCMLSFAWGVSISRVIQGQHSRADILAGAFLGTLVAVVLVLRAIPRYVRVLSPDLDHTHDAGKAVAAEESVGQAV